jgi:hypothetical protein
MQVYLVPVQRMGSLAKLNSPHLDGHGACRQRVPEGAGQSEVCQRAPCNTCCKVIVILLDPSHCQNRSTVGVRRFRTARSSTAPMTGPPAPPQEVASMRTHGRRRGLPAMVHLFSLSR